MKALKVGFWGIVLSAAIALGMVVPSLSAGPAAQGRFQLTYDVQLGEHMSLPTGNYTFSVDRSAGSSGAVAIYHDNQAVGIVLPQVFDGSRPKNDKSELICVRHDGKVVARALQLPGVGTLYFSLPKDLKVLMAEQPQLIQTVSVQVSGQ